MTIMNFLALINQICLDMCHHLSHPAEHSMILNTEKFWVTLCMRIKLEIIWINSLKDVEWRTMVIFVQNGWFACFSNGSDYELFVDVDRTKASEAPRFVVTTLSINYIQCSQTTSQGESLFWRTSVLDWHRGGPSTIQHPRICAKTWYFLHNFIKRTYYVRVGWNVASKVFSLHWLPEIEIENACCLRNCTA